MLINNQGITDKSLPERIFAAGALELVLTELRSNLQGRVTDFDFDSIKIYGADLAKLIQFELPLHKETSALEQSVILIDALAKRIQEFNQGLSASLDQLEVERGELVEETQHAFATIPAISKWIFRSTSPKLNIVRKILPRFEKRGVVSDAELYDDSSLETEIDSWIFNLKSSVFDERENHSRWMRRLSGISKGFQAFMGAISPFLSLKWEEFNTSDSVDSQICSLNAEQIHLSGTLEVFVLYLHKSVAPNTIALVPLQRDAIRASDYLSDQIKQLANQILVRLKGMIQFSKDWMLLRQVFQELLDEEVLVSIVEESKARLRSEKAKQVDSLVDAINQAKAGYLARAECIYRALASESYRFDIEYDRIKDASRRCLEFIHDIDKLASDCVSEYSRLDNACKRFWGADVNHLTESLHLANSVVKRSGLSRDGEAWREVEQCIEKLRPLCEFAEVSFSWVPVTFNSESFDLPPRRLDPLLIFINALCSIGAADGDFCVAEQKSVLEIVREFSPEIDEEKVIDAIRRWTSDANNVGLEKLVCQCVADTMYLRGTPFASIARDSFKAIIHVDGELEANETLVANAMIARVT